MAVGHTKSEIDGEAAKVAIHADDVELPPLPINAEARLTYPGLAKEDEILRPIDGGFLTYADGDFKLADKILPNGLILSDNFVALHQLIKSSQKAKLIYLDPPYATGMEFQSRDLEHAYTDTLGKAAYVEFMRRRLVLLREVLDDDGSIFVHIGHQMVAELKLVMDEIFGARNFRNIITRRKCSSKNFTRNQFANLNDFVLFYTKSSSYVWNQPVEAPDAEWIAKEYPKFDQKGQYKLVPVHAPGVRNGATGTPWRGVNPPPGKHWQYAPSKLDELDAAGEIHWSKTGNPRRKVYLPPNKGVALTDYWDKFRDAHHQSILITGYPTEKNFDMMKMLVAACTNPGDVVLDPFCGSGSTLHAADAQGRKWIGIDQSFVAVKTVIKRLRHGRAPMGDFVKKLDEQDLFVDLPIEPSKHEETGSSFGFFVASHLAQSHAQDLQDLAQSLA